jgi:hypothetical protein
MSKVNPLKNYPAAVRRYIARQQVWRDQTEKELALVARHYGPHCRGYCRLQRQRILSRLGKAPESLTLGEWRDYNKPNYEAQFFLKELWPQLTPAEQEIIKLTTEWAFIFPATFETERDFLVACAARLQRFFKRKFHVSSAPTQETNP